LGGPDGRGLDVRRGLDILKRRFSLRGAAVTSFLLAAASSPLQAQDTFRMVRLAPNVHAAMVVPNPPRYVFANALIIIRARDVVVVDTHQSPSAARVLIDEIRELTDLPVKYVVNTHFHGDHVYGNQSYREAFEGLQFIGHVNTAKDMMSKGAEALATEMAELPQSIADREEWVRTGAGPNGRALAAGQIVQWRRSALLRIEYLAELEGLDLTPPDLTFEGSLTLSDGASPPIHILHFGEAHTRGDVVVYLPQQGIVAVGELVENSLPWVDENSSPAGWAYALAKISDLHADVIIPAHGPLITDRVLLDGQREFMQAVSVAVSEAYYQGADLEETLRQVDRLDLEWFLDSSDLRRGDPFKQYARTVATQAYRALRGER